MTLAALFEPWLEERVLFEDDGLLVVDKPSGLPVHGGDAELSEDVVTRIATRLARRGHDDYLGVHQRLDVGTSGVLLFCRDRAKNAQLAKAFEGHEVSRRYVAAVVDPGLPDAGTFEDRLLATGGRTTVVQRGGVLAVTDFQVLARGAGRALVELRPRTGRTHQLRVQLAHRGAAIAGDSLYGGVAQGRLLLHAQSLRLPSREGAFDSTVPPSFLFWVRGEPEALPEALRGPLRDAFSLRQPLLDVASAFRLVNDQADGFPGVVVDYYDGWVTLALSSEEAEARRAELVDVLLAEGVRGVYVKHRLRADQRRVEATEVAPDLPDGGVAAPRPLLVHEYGQKHEVRLDGGLSSGLFVDQRDNRRRVKARAGNRRVLNLFCYTGAFSVAAALGGASQVVSVDLSRPALDATRRAFALNDLPVAQHEFVQADSFEFLARDVAQRRFDLIVLDPPSFGTQKRAGTFSLTKDFRRLLALTLPALADGGCLLVVTNHRKTSLGRLRSLVRQAAEECRRPLESLRDGPARLDCRPGPDGPSPSKSVWATLGRPSKMRPRR